jgi:hypothetical protein
VLVYATTSRSRFVLLTPQQLALSTGGQGPVSIGAAADVSGRRLGAFQTLESVLARYMSPEKLALLRKNLTHSRETWNYKSLVQQYGEDTARAMGYPEGLPKY